MFIYCETCKKLKYVYTYIHTNKCPKYYTVLKLNLFNTKR